MSPFYRKKPSFYVKNHEIVSNFIIQIGTIIRLKLGLIFWAKSTKYNILIKFTLKIRLFAMNFSLFTLKLWPFTQKFRRFTKAHRVFTQKITPFT